MDNQLVHLEKMLETVVGCERDLRLNGENSYKN